MRKGWRASALGLALLAVVGCGRAAPKGPVIEAPPPSAPVAADPCREPLRLCGAEVAPDATEVTCTGAGIVDLRGLRCRPQVTALRLDEQSYTALEALDDATLRRISELHVETMKTRWLFDMGRALSYGTPRVDGSVLKRLPRLETLKIEPSLADPSVLSGLGGLRRMEVGNISAVPISVLATLPRLTHLDALRAQQDLTALRGLLELREVRGLGNQPGACALLTANPRIRTLAADASLLECDALGRLASLEELSVSGEADLAPLAGVRSLRKLRLFAPPRSGLVALRQIEELSLDLPADKAAAEALIVAVSQLKGLRRLALNASPHDLLRLSLLEPDDFPSLEPLAALPALIDLKGPLYFDLSQIRGLRRLERLEWSGPGDSAHLASMSRLRELEWTSSEDGAWRNAPPLPALEVLHTRDFGDVAPLLQAPRLKEAKLGRVTGDVARLADLVALRELSIDTDVSDLSALGALQKLRRLSLEGYQGTLAWLGRLSSLEKVEISANAPDVASLPASLRLEALTLSGTTVTTLDIPPIRVRELYLGRAPALTNIAFAANLRGLEILSLGKSEVHSVEALRSQTRLTRLRVSEAPLVSLEPLTGLRLQGLSVSGTRVSDLTPLARMHSLVELDLTRSRVDDLRPIGHHPKLTFLDLSGTRMSHVRQLVALPSLHALDISDTGVRDVAPLAERPSLKFLVAPPLVSNFVPLSGLNLSGVWASQYDCDSSRAVTMFNVGMGQSRCSSEEEIAEGLDYWFGPGSQPTDELDAPWEGP
ncbi:MAG: hypothetical protein AAF715_28820 [Myxococcota bacterium]